MDLLLMLWEFFKTGLFAIGGGMATIPFLTRMAQQYPHWFTLSELADMIAVSESTPGPIGVNMSTYVGYTVYGTPGAILATLALTLPSFISILLIAKAYERYRDNRVVTAGFSGLRPAVTGMIAAAGYAVMKLALFMDGKPSLIAVIMFIILFACMQIKKLSKIHPVLYIAAAAVSGMLLNMGGAA